MSGGCHHRFRTQVLTLPKSTRTQNTELVPNSSYHGSLEIKSVIVKRGIITGTVHTISIPVHVCVWVLEHVGLPSSMVKAADAPCHALPTTVAWTIIALWLLHERQNVSGAALTTCHQVCIKGNSCPSLGARRYLRLFPLTDWSKIRLCHASPLEGALWLLMFNRPYRKYQCASADCWMRCIVGLIWINLDTSWTTMHLIPSFTRAPRYLRKGLYRYR